MTAPTEPIMRHAALAFAGEVASIPTARHFAVGTAKEWGLGALRDDVALLVSELVTNTVCHTTSGGHIDLVELAVGGMHVEVCDASTEVPVVGRGAPRDASGRGMRLVDSLSSAWGVVSCSKGKLVWFDLAGVRGAPIPA